MTTIVPVIMSGGSGTRLWPLSTSRRPKQFHALTSDQTLLQETLSRVRQGFDGFAAPVLVCNRKHEQMVREQADQAGVAERLTVIEPEGRSTAPVAALAALLAQQLDPSALVLLLSSDHLVRDPKAFRAAVTTAAPAATDHIVAFGSAAREPTSNYGYIQRGEELGPGVFRVARFTEKPPADVATAYVDSGDYDWNTGIFLFAPGVLLAELEALRPNILQAVRRSVETAQRDGSILRLGPEFLGCPAESLDYAVMEKTARAAVCPVEFGWTDVGGWNELVRLGQPDSGGNVLHGPAIATDCADSLVWAEDRPVAVLGVQDLLVVSTDDGVLVIPRARAHEMPRLIEQLKARQAN